MGILTQHFQTYPHVYQRFLRRNSKFDVFDVLCWETYLLLSSPVPVQMENYWLDLKNKSSTRHIQTASAYVKSHKSTPEYVEFVHRCSELSRAILDFSSPIWSNPSFSLPQRPDFFWLIPQCDTHKCWYRKYYLIYIYYIIISIYYIILYYIISSYIILYYIILYHIILSFYIILYYIMLYYIILYYIILYTMYYIVYIYILYFVQICIIYYILYSILYHIMLYILLYHIILYYIQYIISCIWI